MKNLILFCTIVAFTLYACNKPENAAYGPTDIRVKNISAVQMNQLTVHTYDSSYNYGILNAGSATGYHRFNRAYRIANITATINGQKYKTDTAIYTYEVYLSTVKATYWLNIKSGVPFRLKIDSLVLESALK